MVKRSKRVIAMFQHLLKAIVTFYLFLNRLKKGVYEHSVGILRFVPEVIEPALLKEWAQP
jgi:hypothetical protein